MNYKIKDICKQRGLLMRDLAEKLGITEVGLSKSLNGNPTIGRLEEIAKVLDVDVTDLFEKQSHDTTLTCPKCGTKLELTLKE